MANYEFLNGMKHFYSGHLCDVLLEYWLDRADDEFGGFFTCYDNTGERLVSTDKFVWSQGRLVWMYSKLASTTALELDEKTRRRCAELAARGARFVADHCILEGGECAFLLDREGNPKEFRPGSGHNISTFADCFVIMGLAAYAEYAGDSEMLEKALTLFNSVTKRMSGNMFRTVPNVVPSAWRCHSIPMIVLNTGQELYGPLRKMGYCDEAAKVESVCAELMNDVVSFITEQGLVLQYLDKENGPMDTLSGRCVNNGHANESMWFVIREALRLGSNEIIGKAAAAVLKTSQAAWDDEYGGMFYYIDRDGGIPKGHIADNERQLDEEFVHDWDCKLWWVHTETIYANLLCYAITKDDSFLKEYERYHDYTFRTFPNTETSSGEWIQIRDRQGRPGNPNVGGRLPVKDPYHSMRNLLFLVELLDNMCSESCSDNITN